MNNYFHTVPSSLFTQRLRLRRFHYRDARPLAETVGHSLPELSRWLPWAQGLYGLSEARIFVRGSARSWRRGKAFDFSVRLREGSAEIVGGVGIWHTSPTEKSGEVGYWIKSDLTGMGLATEAAGALLTLGFRDMGLHRILMRIAVGNRPSRRVAEKLGFTYEGIAREEILVRGQWMDHEVFSLLEREWLSAGPR